MATAKKTTAKKTTAKKSAAKKAPARSSRAVEEMRMKDAAPIDVGTVAQEVFDGKHGTGRERDDKLRQMGHDANVVMREVTKLRAAAKPEVARLPIPNNRKPSTVRTW